MKPNHGAVLGFPNHTVPRFVAVRNFRKRYVAVRGGSLRFSFSIHRTVWFGEIRNDTLRCGAVRCG